MTIVDARRSFRFNSRHDAHRDASDGIGRSQRGEQAEYGIAGFNDALLLDVADNSCYGVHIVASGRIWPRPNRVELFV